MKNIEYKIGQVTFYSDQEGTYAGNISNAFPKGTEYYSIKDQDPSDVIAIRTQEHTYFKAMNKGHYDNDHLEGLNRYWAHIIVGAGILVIFLIYWILRRKRVNF